MNFFKIKEVKDIELDSIERTIYHGKIIKKKKYLYKLYTQWYLKIKDLIEYDPSKKYLELGSGSGFIKEIMPNILTSDILPVPGLDFVFDALKMPFDDESIDGIIMIDVFHHVPDSFLFLKEVNRILKPNGKLVMSEPSNSPWSRFIYKNFHHEPFIENGSWVIDSDKPLSSANGALPWIVFQRDYGKFKNYFQNLNLISIKYHSPLTYLLTGGLSLIQIVPDFLMPLFVFIDKKFTSNKFCMFAFYTIQKSK